MPSTPWGMWFPLPNETRNFSFDFKLLIVKPQQSTSLQKHQFHDEEWKFLTSCTIIRGLDDVVRVNAGETVLILRDTWHAIVNPRKDQDVYVYEKRIGHLYLNPLQREEDIERVYDLYGRGDDFPPTLKQRMFQPIAKL